MNPAVVLGAVSLRCAAPASLGARHRAAAPASAPQHPYGAFPPFQHRRLVDVPLFQAYIMLCDIFLHVSFTLLEVPQIFKYF